MGGVTSPLQLAENILRIYRSPLAFAEAVGRKGIVMPDGTIRKRFGPIHQAIIDQGHSSPRSSTIISRGHGKTTLAECEIGWEICLDPSDRQMIGSAALGLAKMMVGNVRTMLHGDLEIAPGWSVPLGEIFPHAVPDSDPRRNGPCEEFNVRGRVGLEREPTLFAMSVGRSMAGRHPKKATIDDPVDEQNSHTAERRAGVIEFIEQLEPVMYTPDSPIRHRGTPWAFGDVSDYMRDSGKWTQIRLGCWDGANPLTGEKDGAGPGPDGAWPLDAGYLNAEEIFELQANLDPVFFASQYLCDPIPARNALFPPEVTRAASDKDLTRQVLFGRGSKVSGCPDIILWDPVGRTEGKLGDTNGIVVVRAIPAAYIDPRPPDPHRNIFVPLFAKKLQGTVDDAARFIEEDLVKRKGFNFKELWIETVAAQGVIASWMEERNRLGGIRVKKQKIPTKALPYRVSGLVTAMRKGHFRIPPEFEGRDEMLRDLNDYPMVKYDDMIAALALLSQPLERKGQAIIDTSQRAAVDMATQIWNRTPPGQGPWPG